MTTPWGFMINLLPPEEKKELIERESQKLMIIWGILLSLFFISFIAGLFSMKFYLSGQILFQKTLVEISQKELNRPENQALKKEIRLLNKDIAKISSFYKNTFFLTEFLEKIANSLPQGVVLDSLSYQRENFSLIITGFAKTREELLLFKKNLEGESSFSEVSFPPSNWVKSEDINFFANIKLSFSQ